MKILTRATMTAALAFMLAAPAVAQEFTSGDITVDQPWARATPKGATVGGAYMVIHNNGKVVDRLVGGSADVTPTVQVHQMTMDQGIMRMREIKGGLEIPAGAQVSFTPSSYHLMMLDLKKPLTKGETVSGTLVFEHAGTIAVQFKVGGFGDTGPAAATGAAPDAMKGMSMMPAGH